MAEDHQQTEDETASLTQIEAGGYTIRFPENGQPLDGEDLNDLADALLMLIAAMGGNTAGNVLIEDDQGFYRVDIVFTEHDETPCDVIGPPEGAA